MRGTIRRKESSGHPVLMVIRLSALGDVAMTIPVVYSFARQYPGWRVRVLTRAAFAPLFVNPPSNLSVLPIEPAMYKGLRGFFRVLGLLRKEKVTRVADFHNVLRSWGWDIAFRLVGCRVAMVRKRRLQRPGWWRLGRPISAQQAYADRYLDVLARLDLPVYPDFESLFTDGSDVLLPADCCPQAELVAVGIAPFARYRNKTYPLELMRQVVALLQATGRYHVFLFGAGGAEQAVLREWEADFPCAVALPERLTMRQELFLMSKLQLMVTMDSANMHLASLAGTPVLSIWGGTTPRCGFLGWRQTAERALLAGLPCQPCCVAGTDSCRRGDYACLTSVPAERVFRAIEIWGDIRKKTER